MCSDVADQADSGTKTSAKDKELLTKNVVEERRDEEKDYGNNGQPHH